MPAPDPIRVLLLGTGFGGLVHAPGFASDPAYRLVGVASGHMDRAKQAAQAHGIPYATDDWKKMLEEVDADLVAVVTPVDLHYPMARAALEKRRHVLLEKPFALNVAQAKELAALAKSQGVVAIVNHEFRHQPGRAALTQWIADGRLGRVEHLVMRTRLPGWARSPERRLTWLTEKERGGGFLGALGSHDVDQILLWGGPIRRVFGRLRLLAPSAPGVSAAHRAITAEDCYTLLLEFESGATGTLATTIKTPFDWRIAVYGENCRAESVSETRAIVRYAGKEPEVIDRPADNHLGRNLDYFAKAVLGQGKFPIPPAGILQTAAALEAVFKSVDANGVWTTV